MSPPGFAAVILAAGEGSRLKSGRPKVLHEIAGQALIRHVVAALRPLEPAATVVVIGRDMDAVAREVAPLPTAIQFPPRGTGDAVRMACPVLADRLAGDGDDCRPRRAVRRHAADRHRDDRRPDRGAAPGAAKRPSRSPAFGRPIRRAYGRLVLDRDGRDARAHRRGEGRGSGRVGDRVVQWRDHGDRRPLRLRSDRRDRQRQRQARILPDRHRRDRESARSRMPRRSKRPRRTCSASTRGPNWPRPRRRCRTGCAAARCRKARHWSPRKPCFCAPTRGSGATSSSSRMSCSAPA